MGIVFLLRFACRSPRDVVSTTEKSPAVFIEALPFGRSFHIPRTFSGRDKVKCTARPSVKFTVELIIKGSFGGGMCGLGKCLVPDYE